MEYTAKPEAAAIHPGQPQDAVADWQQDMQTAIRSLDTLLTALALSPRDVAVSRAAAEQFPVLVTPAMLARMRPGDPRDPLLLQFLPRLEETFSQPPGYGGDPVSDSAALRGEGLLQKYAGRLLAISTGACAVHCRYCFRRHFPYSEQHAGAGRWQGALTLLRDDPSLHELILSGGDPLMLTDRRLAALLEPLAGIASVRRLRIHTRLPVVLPSRIDAGLAALLTAFPRALVVVVHVNHPRELDTAAAAALSRLRHAGSLLLNQAVLLRGINDDLSTQMTLWQTLADAGVMPYYLHLLDPVTGAAHFDVPEHEARALVAALRARLPGYLVPRLAREIPGEPAKTVLA
ncbi:MAG: EF-P beta-lysylation protein EpmB [Gammaproteobacteria bacterium]|nr:EF-P beta-lysylation protein EpmB [Gammaproteobacteria bacterium]